MNFGELPTKRIILVLEEFRGSFSFVLLNWVTSTNDYMTSNWCSLFLIILCMYVRCVGMFRQPPLHLPEHYFVVIMHIRTAKHIMSN